MDRSLLSTRSQPVTINGRKETLCKNFFLNNLRFPFTKVFSNPEIFLFIYFGSIQKRQVSSCLYYWDILVLSSTGKKKRKQKKTNEQEEINKNEALQPTCCTCKHLKIIWNCKSKTLGRASANLSLSGQKHFFNHNRIHILQLQCCSLVICAK